MQLGTLETVIQVDLMEREYESEIEIVHSICQDIFRI